MGRKIQAYFSIKAEDVINEGEDAGKCTIFYLVFVQVHREGIEIVPSCSALHQPATILMHGAPFRFLSFFLSPLFRGLIELKSIILLVYLG